MKNYPKLLRPLTVLAVAILSSAAGAYELTESPECDVGAAVFNPQYDACYGAYLLGNGENDVTDGEADNIVNQLLNTDEIFGDDEWTFLEKRENDTAGTYFTVSGMGSTSGSITFDTTAIEAEYGPTFIQDYDIVISLKAAKNFSIYQWDAALGTNTITWSTAGTATNGGGIVQALSHVSVYFQYNGSGDDQDDDSSTVIVSEPKTLALLAFGLCGLVLVRRRRTTSSYH